MNNRKKKKQEKRRTYMEPTWAGRACCAGPFCGDQAWYIWIGSIVRWLCKFCHACPISFFLFAVIVCELGTCECAAQQCISLWKTTWSTHERSWRLDETQVYAWIFEFGIQTSKPCPAEPSKCGNLDYVWSNWPRVESTASVCYWPVDFMPSHIFWSMKIPILLALVNQEYTHTSPRLVVLPYISRSRPPDSVGTIKLHLVRTIGLWQVYSTPACLFVRLDLSCMLVRH